MGRLAIEQREQMPQADQHYYDRILRTRGRVAGPFSVLLNSPDIAERIAFLGSFIVYESILSPRVKYLSMLLAARSFDCDYVWDAVLPHAREADLDDELAAALAAGEAPTSASDEDLLVARYCRKLLGGNHHVDDETYRAVVDHFGVPAAAQIAYTVGYVVMIAMLCNAFEVEVDLDDPELVM